MKYLIIFLISMLPIIELRGAMPIAQEFYHIDFFPALLICVVGNMIPVPIIYFFARRFLEWGADKKYIGKICRFMIRKGEKAGNRLSRSSMRFGAFLALMLFVGIPVPGTGAWTGTLAASFLDMGFKSTVISVCLGVVLAGVIMALSTSGVVGVFSTIFG